MTKTVLLISIAFAACSSPNQKEIDAMKDALTLYASFDQADCDFALGDKKMYTTDMSSRLDLSDDPSGINTTDAEIAPGKGYLGGGALHFQKKSQHLLYYRSEKNINYNRTNWTSTISFWLKVDPVNELEPGYTDPIQITDISYNDAAIWVDFTKENPRDFRLGVIGDLAPRQVDSTYNEEKYFETRLVKAKTLPFASDKWTHVLIKIEKLNTQSGQASLYLDGKLQQTRNNIGDDFDWDIKQSNIFLGINFTGMMDELVIFNKALSDKEIETLYQMKAPLKSLL